MKTQEDMGGNWTLDRIEANHDQYDDEENAHMLATPDEMREAWINDCDAANNQENE